MELGEIYAYQTSVVDNQNSRDIILRGLTYWSFGDAAVILN